MKKQLLSILLLTSSITLGLTTKTYIEPIYMTINDSQKSILNYSSSMGKFKDLTTEEIKSYYSTLEDKKGIKGDELLSYLQPILKENHTKISHSKAWSSDWYYFTLLDRDYEADPLTATEISTGKWKTDNVKIVPLYTEKTTFVKANKQFDREHVWPKSRGFKYATSTSEDNKGLEQPYAATDMQNLRMGEVENNEHGHSNYPYGEVANKDASTTKKITSKVTNTITGYTGLNKNGITVYEPRDEDKGDIARMLFYMATRYHSYFSSETFEPSLKLVSTFTSDSEAQETLICANTKDTPATYGILEDLLLWNKADPVSEFEIHRNNLCYNIVQNNRNPYIDYPGWADVAFGNSTYGINLNSDDGLDSVGLSVNKGNTKTYSIGSILDTSNDTLSFKKEDGTSITVDKNDAKLYVEYNNERKEVTSDYKFEKDGTYKIIYTYTFEDTTYEAYYTITIEKEKTFFEKYQNYFYIALVVLVAILSTIIGIVANKNKKKKNIKNNSNINKNKASSSKKKNPSSRKR